MRSWLIFGFVAISARSWAAMPPAEQNALVKQYCAVCHTDASMNGGLSLQHYDAARRDPTLAAMILSKLNSGAMGAAGKGVPDKPAQQAWLDSTREQAAGDMQWFVNREAGLLSASVVREVPPRPMGPPDPPVYRVKIACNAATGVGEMRLTWSPAAVSGVTMTASVDGAAPVEYKISGQESMGNGAAGQSGRAYAVLDDGAATRLPLPKQSLVIRGLFAGETVEFPFSELDPRASAELGHCF